MNWDSSSGITSCMRVPARSLPPAVSSGWPGRPSGTDFHRNSRHKQSECVFDGELHDPRTDIRQDLAKGAAVQRRRRVQEIRLVLNVERFGAYLEALAFPHSESA